MTHSMNRSAVGLILLSLSWVGLSGVVLIVAACVQIYSLASEADGNATQEQGGSYCSVVLRPHWGCGRFLVCGPSAHTRLA